MTCEECHDEKPDQKYDDVCDACVRKMMKTLWEEKVRPSTESFLDQIKNDGSDEST